MKMTFLMAAIFSVINCFPQRDQSQSSFGKEMAAIMQHMKEYTIAIAKQMPEDHYEFRPSNDDTVRTFGEQLKHLIYVNNQQADYLLRARPFDVQELIRNLEAYEEIPMGKAEIIEKISGSYDKLIKRINEMTDVDFDTQYEIPFLKGSKSLRVMVMFVRDHNTHHRAQLVSYLRMNNIKPAAYRPF